MHFYAKFCGVHTQMRRAFFVLGKNGGMYRSDGALDEVEENISVILCFPQTG